MNETISNTNVTRVAKKRPLVCMIGTLRAVDLTSGHLIEKVIQPLNADLLFCVSRIDANDEIIIKKFKDCNIVDVYIYEEAKDNYQDFLDNFFNKLSSKEQDQWHEYLKIDGNWLGGIKERRGSGFHLNFNYLKLLERLKTLKKNGFEYQRYIITRTDFLWMVEHPPLNLLEPKLIWTPAGENYNGYNDRHAVCSDQNISHYLNLLEFMFNFQALEYIYNNVDENNLSHERHLKSHLDYCGVKVSTFNNVAYLTGNQQTLTNWASVKLKSIDGVEYAYKYENELLSCLENVKQFNLDGNWNMMIKNGDKKC
jgi:hypothetical protein